MLAPVCIRNLVEIQSCSRSPDAATSGHAGSRTRKVPSRTDQVLTSKPMSCRPARLIVVALLLTSCKYVRMPPSEQDMAAMRSDDVEIAVRHQAAAEAGLRWVRLAGTRIDPWYSQCEEGLD